MGLLDNFLEYELYSDWNRFTISLRDKYTREVEYNFYDEGLKGLFKKAKGLRTWRLDHYESAGGRYLAFYWWKKMVITSSRPSTVGSM